MHRSGAAPVVGVTVVKLRVGPARMENYRHDWTRTCLPAGRSPWCVRRRLAGTNGVAVAAVASVALLAGCTPARETGAKQSSNALSTPSTAPPQGERPVLSTTKPTKAVKMAIIAIENNPFFAQVKTGYNAVKPKIEAAGGTVDWITAGTDVTVDSVGDAINAAVVDGYDAVAALMPGDGICTYIRQANAKGVLVAAYNGNASCAQSSGAVFFHGQDLRAAGVQAGELMCTATTGPAPPS